MFQSISNNLNSHTSVWVFFCLISGVQNSIITIMNNILKTRVQSAKWFIHLDTHERVMHWRFIIHTVVLRCLILLTFVWSLQESLMAVLTGMLTISYIPLMVIEVYHREDWRQWYLYGWIIITALWALSGMFNSHRMINALWSAWFLTIGRWVLDYCRVIRRWKIRNIYNQVSAIGIFLISIIFAVITMWRFQSINFDCSTINFINPQFFMKINQSDPAQAQIVKDVVASGGRSNYLQLLDRWLVTNDNDASLANTIKTQIRNWVIVVMDQKKLYDNSVCDYVTTALNNNYQKPSFFYSGVLLLTFIGLAPARIALVVIAGLFSIILRILYRFGIYRRHASIIEHQVLE